MINKRFTGDYRAFTQLLLEDYFLILKDGRIVGARLPSPTEGSSGFVFEVMGVDCKERSAMGYSYPFSPRDLNYDLYFTVDELSTIMDAIPDSMRDHLIHAWPIFSEINSSSSGAEIIAFSPVKTPGTDDTQLLFISAPFLIQQFSTGPGYRKSSSLRLRLYKSEECGITKDEYAVPPEIEEDWYHGFSWINLFDLIEHINPSQGLPPPGDWKSIVTCVNCGKFFLSRISDVGQLPFEDRSCHICIERYPELGKGSINYFYDAAPWFRSFFSEWPPNWKELMISQIQLLIKESESDKAQKLLSETLAELSEDEQKVLMTDLTTSFTNSDAISVCFQTAGTLVETGKPEMAVNLFKILKKHANYSEERFRQVVGLNIMVRITPDDDVETLKSLPPVIKYFIEEACTNADEALHQLNGMIFMFPEKAPWIWTQFLTVIPEQSLKHLEILGIHCVAWLRSEQPERGTIILEYLLSRDNPLDVRLVMEASSQLAFALLCENKLQYSKIIYETLLQEKDRFPPNEVQHVLVKYHQQLLSEAKHVDPTPFFDYLLTPTPFLPLKKGLVFMVLLASALHVKEYHKEIFPIYDYLVAKREALGVDIILETFSMLAITLITTEKPYESQKIFDYLFDHIEELGFDQVIREMHIIMIKLVMRKEESEGKPVYEYLKTKESELNRDLFQAKYREEAMHTINQREETQ